MNMYQSCVQAENMMQDIQNGPHVIRQQNIDIQEFKEKYASIHARSIQLDDPVDAAGYIEEICAQHSLKLVSLPRDQEEVKDGIKMVQTAFSLEGNLSDILKGIHQIEFHDRAAVVRSLGLQTESWYERGEVHKELIADVQLERVVLEQVASNK